MEKDEWEDKHKYKVTLENLVENHVILMKFLEDNFGNDAIVKYYATKNEMNYENKIGRGIKLGAKVIKTLSSKKFFSIFIDQLIKNAQYMIPVKCIIGIDYGEKTATIHIDKCPSKRIFRRGVKKFKVQDQIPITAFCELNCIPTFQTYGRIGNIKVSANFTEKGCDIFAEI
ncbi:MAG: hypothetical protein HWN66_00320 [Candidatus Helarchaeota archaeon]|nr:hypothetical protein [Candidatus Helarchaeota archaeon]